MRPVYHLGECLDIPWVCCSPCLVPGALLRGFEASFLLSFSELALVMRARDEGLKFETTGFSWADVNTEFWPFFTENQSLLREEPLELPQVLGYSERDPGDNDESASYCLAKGVAASWSVGARCHTEEVGVEAPTASSGGGTVGTELSGGHLFTFRLETFLDSCAVQPTRASKAWVRRVSSRTRPR